MPWKVLYVNFEHHNSPPRVLLWGELLDLFLPSPWKSIKCLFSLSPNVHDASTAYVTINFVLGFWLLNCIEYPEVHLSVSYIWRFCGHSSQIMLGFSFLSMLRCTLPGQVDGLQPNLFSHHASPTTSALLPSKLECLHCASYPQTLTPLLIQDRSLIALHLRCSLLVYPNTCLPWFTDVLLGSHNAMKMCLSATP